MDGIMKMAYGPLQLTPDQLFELTYFQFVQLARGYHERDQYSWVKLAHLQHTIAQSQTTERLRMSDFLPWYDDWLRDQQGLPPYEPPEIDFSIPQLIRVTIKVLEGWGFDPYELPDNSEDWDKAEKVARSVIGIPEDAVIAVDGVEGEDYVIYQGVPVKKADPKIWGAVSPWEQEELNKEKMRSIIDRNRENKEN